MHNDPNQPPQTPSDGPLPFYGVPPAGFVPPPGYYPPLPYGPPPPMYGVPPFPGYPPFMPPPPQPKKSLRWLWILLSVLGGLLVLSCGSCTIGTVYQSVASLSSVSSSSSTSSFSNPSVNLGAYYLEIEQQEYDLAYKHLASDATFTLDGQDIPITSQTIFNTTEQQLIGRFGEENDHLVYLQDVNATTATLTVTVTRGSQDYTELVTMTKNGRVSSSVITWFISHETIMSTAVTPTPTTP